MAPEDVRGDTGATEGGDYKSFLDDQAQEFGDPEVGDEVLDGLEASAEGGKRSGTDKVLARLQEVDPEAATLLKGMQRKMSQSINQVNKMQDQLLELRERTAPAAPAAPAVEPPPGVTEENLHLFQQMADFLGYVPRKEVEEREQGRASTDYVQQALQQGVELYGEDFGYMDDDGRAVVNPDIAERLERRLQQLQDPHGGITPLDLYVLETRGGASGAGERAAGTGSRPVRRAQVARRSTGGGGQRLKIYDERRGDSADDVLNRAWVVGKRRTIGA